MNYLAILVSAVLAMVIGSLWYGPIFGKQYMKVMGMDMMTPEMKAAMKKKMWGMYFVQFVLSLVSIYVLAYMGASVKMAFWVWLGFVMPTIGSGALWSGKSKSMSWSLFFLTAGCNLVTFLAYGWVLSMWK